MKRLFALVLIMSLALVSGCGRKTAPLPPKAVIAEAISDLRSQLDDQAVTLSWTYPRRSINGARIDNIRSFIVYKARIPAADYCNGCPVVFDYRFEVGAQGSKPGHTVTYRDPDILAGFHYIYMIRANSGWRILSKDSNRIHFHRQHPLMPPGDLQVDIGDSTLTMSWAPVGHRTDGTEASGIQYQVYRSQDNKKFSPLGLPTEGLSFIDPAVTNGRTYFYQVRAVVAEQDIMILGRPSKTAIGMPVDMTPPAPPSNLATVIRRQGVQLHWLGSPSDDVHGYHIYRSDSQGAWQRIASTSAGAITYTDLSELPAGVYSYRVTAFDKSLRGNESKPSAAVTYTKP